jgi:hypothetical protein
MHYKTNPNTSPEEKGDTNNVKNKKPKPRASSNHAQALNQTSDIIL